MERLRLEIKLKSYALVGSGEGFGSIIDQDVIFDDFGLPYIPARRIKGLLRESSLEICEMGLGFEKKHVDSIFGKPDKDSDISISNLRIKDDEKVCQWLLWAFDNKGFKGLLNRNSVIDVLTEIRHQTAIEEDKGIAHEGSLRTIRVLKPEIENIELKFEGVLNLNNYSVLYEQLLSYACINLRHIGAMRNRGFGLCQCTLIKETENITGKFENELKVSYGNIKVKAQD